MKKTIRFSDPNPDAAVEKRTSNPTSEEATLLEKFDPLSADTAENIAGAIVRAAVDIARYRRSKEHDPEHYARLERAAAHLASVRVAHASCTEQPGIIEGITAALNTTDWGSAPEVPRPQVLVTVPYSGTELGPATIAFINQPDHDRASQPA
jgi:hypothetical protein